jgi:hypothetical protein
VVGDLKDLVRPPFANYDVVVYFGGGLFAIPFINRYIIEPLNLTWPAFEIQTDSAVLTQVIGALCLLFSIYIFGHMLAYAGSQLIEKLIDRIFGKISTGILVSLYSTARGRNEMIRAMIHDRTKSIKRDKAIFPTVARTVFHIPFFPIYLLVYVLGVFGYYNTRLSREVMNQARKKMIELDIGGTRIALRSRWFKTVEYAVINRSQSATQRMYNYLVISGLFRTLCTVFLMCAWLQLYYICHHLFDGQWLIDGAMGTKGPFSGIIEFAITCLIYTFCSFSYIKFQRRYAEEAIFAFVFDKNV